VAIQALQLVTEEEGGYFLEAKIELGSAPCWRSKFVGEQLRAEVEKGTLSFPALSTALGHERHPVVAPPITANHSVYASIKLASADPAVYPRLRDELATLVAAEAQGPAAHVTVHLRQQAPQALLQRGRRSEPSALEPGAETEAREPSLKEAVADISISGVASGRAQAVTGALVLSFAQGSVKAKLTEHGISIKDSLVVHKPTIEGAKASLEELVHEREKQLAEAKEAQKAGEDLLNHDAKGAARRVEEVEGQVEDLEAKLKALEGATDAPPPSVETSPEPKTPPTASPPAEGTKVVEDVELSEADAGESAKLALPSSVHFNPTFTIAAVLISGSLAVVIGLLWFFGNLVPTYTANS
jgi:polyhydroxyalkanoate synthesis regulator phasin